MTAVWAGRGAPLLQYESRELAAVQVCGGNSGGGQRLELPVPQRPLHTVIQV